MEMGQRERVTCAGIVIPVSPCLAKQLTQSRVFHLWSLREGQHLPLNPPIQHSWGQMRPPGTPFPAEDPPQKVTWRKHSLPIAKTNTRGRYSLRGWYLEKAGTWGAAASLWIITTSQNHSQGPAPCFRWDEQGVRASKSPFLNASSFDLSQGSVLPHHTKPW